MRWSTALIIMLSIVWPALARAQSAGDGFDFGAEAPAEPVTWGPELGARAGYATGFGRVEPSKRLQHTVAGAVPLWLDVGFRINRRWLVGGYGHYGLALASATSQTRCPDCQHTWVRYGVQAQYRFYDAGRRNMWLGLGTGREVLNTSIDEYEESSRSIRGWEIINLQLGSEIHVVEGLGIGPYLSFSVDSFGSKLERCRDEHLCPSDERRVQTDLSGLHGWVNAGLRVVLLP